MLPAPPPVGRGVLGVGAGVALEPPPGAGAAPPPSGGRGAC